MPHLFATFDDRARARAAFDALVGDGVTEDDLSLVGAAGSSVDDEAVGLARIARVDYLNEIQTIEEQPIGGIDTSDSGTNVDSVDQADDSQEIANQMIYPRDEISFAAHQNDEYALAAMTGFPTTIPQNDELTVNFEEDEDDGSGDLPVLGGGDFATAALGAPDDLRAFLRETGLGEEEAGRLAEAVGAGSPVVGVSVAPQGPSLDELSRRLSEFGATQVIEAEGAAFHDAESPDPAQR